MLQLFDSKITERYEEAKNLLLNPENYTETVDLALAKKYLDFLDCSLLKVTDRMTSLAAFIRDADGLMVSKMYPFALLREIEAQNVEDIYSEVVKLAECYTILAPAYAESLHQ